MSAVFAAGEREQLEAMLDGQRAELLASLDGLSEADGRARLVPSATTVLGLVKHATFVETVWFPHRLGGRSRAELGISEDVDDSFVLDPADTVASVRAAYEAAGVVFVHHRSAEDSLRQLAKIFPSVKMPAGVRA